MLISGWGTPSPYVDYQPLINKLESHYKIVTYERFGYGFSDQTKQERNIDNLVKELDLVINNSKLKPPYTLVAHSLGSLEAFGYAQKYPENVKGIVLIDAGNPELYAMQKPVLIISKMQNAISKLGITRLMIEQFDLINSVLEDQNDYKFVGKSKQEKDALLEIVRNVTLKNYPNETMLAELEMSQKNAKVVMGNGTLGNIPIIALTADEYGSQSKQWYESQKSIASWTSNFENIIIKNTKHYIHQYNPQVVIDAIMKIDKSDKDREREFYE